MEQIDVKRDLLVGLVALENGVISRESLLSGCIDWQHLHDTSLLDCLVRNGYVGRKELNPIEPLADQLISSGDETRSIGHAPSDDGPSETQRFAKPACTDSKSPANSEQRTLGRFTIVRPYAKGGLGTVSLAMDHELNREVALKEIRQEIELDESSRTRFVVEAKVTGNLEHPGVVPVYGLGHTSDGSPYYAMRLIRGESLKAAIKEFHEQRDIREFSSVEFRRLIGSFVAVCNAVEYAHSRGIIHRDLKPENIMLGEYGETIVVDWGLAKRTTEELSTESSLVHGDLPQSKDGNVMGTPGYMPPEQALGMVNEHDEKSDVYALGATLYYILTNKLPVTGNNGKELIKQTISGNIIDAAAEIRSRLPKPLEAICRKAMCMNKEDRYDSPLKLAEDVECWLADESISVHRDPVHLRIARWARRHQKLTVAVSTSILVSALCLLVLVVVVSGKNRELTVANKVSRERFQLAMNAIENHYTGVSKEVILEREELRPLRTKLLRSALEFYQKLESTLSGSKEPEARQSLADAYHAIGLISSAVGEKSEGIAALKREIDVLRELENAALPDRFASAYTDIALMQSEIGLKKQASSNYELAKKHFDRIPVAKRSYAVQLSYCVFLLNSGSLKLDLGEIQSARRCFEESIESLKSLHKRNEETPESMLLLSGSFGSLGIATWEEERGESAIVLYEQALEIQTRLVNLFPQSHKCLLNLCRSEHAIATIASSKKRMKLKAAEFFVRAIQSSEKLQTLQRTNHNYKSLEATTRQSFAQFLRGDQSQSAEASRQASKAVRLFEELLKSHPNISIYKSGLALSYQSLGFLGENPESAIAWHSKAQNCYRELSESEPNVASHKIAFAGTHCNLGNAMKVKDPNLAIVHFRKATSLLAELAKESVLAGDYLTQTVLSEARTLKHVDRLQDAVDLFAKFDRQILGFNLTTENEFDFFRASCHNDLGVLSEANGRNETARKHHLAAIAIYEQILERDPASVESSIDLGGAQCNIANTYFQSNVEKALTWYNSATRVLSKFPESNRAKKFLYNSSRGQRRSLLRLGRYADLVPVLRRLVEIAPANGKANFQIDLCTAMAVTGKPRQAMEALEGFISNRKGDARFLFMSARICAICYSRVSAGSELTANQIGKLQANYSKRACELLRLARKAGYFDTTNDVANSLEKEPAFNPIKNTAAFFDLLQEFDEME